MKETGTSVGHTLRGVIEAHGGGAGATLVFGEDPIDLLPYETLRVGEVHGRDVLGPVLGIHEWQGAPLMVLVDGDRLAGGISTHRLRHLSNIRRLVALRGDIPYIGVTEGGRLDVSVVGLGRGVGESVDFDALDVATVTRIPYLATARPGISPQSRTISKVVLKLLDDALTRLNDCGLTQEDAISLAGRSLFARFLADRDLPVAGHVGTDLAFADARATRLTCRWLDETFNGNLLPLDLGVLDGLSREGFGVLTDIMRRAPNGQMSLGWQQRWDNLHFAHIPVGVLSQVYEQYLKRHQPKRQKAEGSFYTPVLIADLMVRATLQGMPPKDRHRARFLDPAAGAGVFLITAFRHLVAERWRHDGVRPGTPVLREMLYDQIAGFDINEGALRFSALGLYLASIELDPEPEPLSKLGFEDLRRHVLHLPTTGRTMTTRKGPVGLDKLGSLGPDLPEVHKGRYDVMIGNPPWTAGVTPEGWRWVENHVRGIARSRNAISSSVSTRDGSGDGMATGKAGRAFKAPSANLIPNNAPDLPFLWRAAEWVKPDGQIALALHGRLLFVQSEGMPEARKALFRAFDVTSIINGAALRNTRVWPEVGAPFCLLFARNRVAGPMSAMRFVSPRREPRLNGSGNFRLDAVHAPLVSLEQVERDPTCLKTLFRGSELDLDIKRRVVERGFPTMGEVVERAGGISGVGYQALRNSSRIRKGQSLPGADASYLKGMPLLQAGAPDRTIDVSRLPRFDEDRIHDPRSRDVFMAPLLIVDKVARTGAGGFASGSASEDVLYSENYYGYSFHRNPGERSVTSYLAAILRSSFVRWWMLMTSGEYGVEREVVEKKTFDALPVPAHWTTSTHGGDAVGETGSAASLAQTHPPGSGIDPQGLAVWYGRLGGDLDQKALDDRVASAYGLTAMDRRVIEDTLRYAFDREEVDDNSSVEAGSIENGATSVERRRNSKKAREAATSIGKEVKGPEVAKVTSDAFVEGIRTQLDPWGREFDVSFHIREIAPSRTSMWRFVVVDRSNLASDDAVPPTAAFVNAADESGSTEVYHEASDGRLWIGMPDAQRYWTFSQGILGGRHLIWRHLDHLLGAEHREGQG